MINPKIIPIIIVAILAFSGCVEPNDPCNQYDVNGDGCVNQLDIDSVSDHYGETGTPGWIPQDVNDDGEVSVLDITLVSNNLGCGCE